LTAGLLLTTGSTLAEHTLPAPAHPQLENTERNVRDSGNATLTPEDQKETRGDINLTAAIRRTVVKNKSLSLDAQNAKIITRNGVVTLRGPVENPAEKIKLQAIAQKTRGVKQVDNQLETKTP
jgi:hyperosmotically inducible protein